MLDQLRRLPVPAELRMTPAELERAAAWLRRSVPPTARRSPRQAALPVAMVSRLRRVACIRETRELGKDEISVSATVIDDLGNATPVAPIDFGKFKTGDVVDLAAAPRELFRFDLTGGAFPKTFAVLYFLVEDDPVAFAVVQSILAIAGLALGLAGAAVIAAAGSVVTLGVVLGGLGLAMAGFAVAFGYRFPVLAPPPRSVVEFPSQDQLTFVDENGDKSVISIPETFAYELFGGRYELTSDFLLV